MSAQIHSAETILMGSTNSNLLIVSTILIGTNSIHNKHNEYTVLVCTNRVGTNSTPQT